MAATNMVGRKGVVTVFGADYMCGLVMREGYREDVGNCITYTTG